MKSELRFKPVALLTIFSAFSLSAAVASMDPPTKVPAPGGIESRAPMPGPQNGGLVVHYPVVSEATCPGQVTTVKGPGGGDDILICTGAKRVEVGPEVSALLLSPEYAQLLVQLQDEATKTMKKGESLILDGFTVRWYGVAERVSARFFKRTLADGNVSEALWATISGQVALDSSENIVIMAMSITGDNTPPPHSPSGASVGN